MWVPRKEDNLEVKRSLRPEDLLACQERILRSAFGAHSRAEALELAAAILNAHIPHRRAWIAELHPDRAQAVLTHLCPGGELECGLPSRLPVGRRLQTVALAQGGMVHLSGAPDDAYDDRLRSVGVESHLSLGLPAVNGRPRMLTLAAWPARAYSHADAELLERLGATLGAALSLPETQRSPRGGSAVLDPTEIQNYVCRAIAHEIRNILSGIIGAVELHRAQFGDHHAPIFSAIQRRAVEGIAMAEAMREHLRSGEVEPLEPVELRALAKETVKLLAPVFAGLEWAHPVDIRCGGDEAWTKAEPGELQRALTALLFNAVRAAGAGGFVEVTTGVENRRAVLAVRDSGPGLGAEAQRRAKEPFYTTEENGHQGLGLAIAEGVARRYGGCVSYDPRREFGTTWAIRLPLSDER